MLELIGILVILGVALWYLVRHYARIYQAEQPQCSGCSGCQGAPRVDSGGPCAGEDSCCTESMARPAE